MKIAKPLIALSFLAVAAPTSAQAPNKEVTLRETYKAGVHYTTVKRGGITEKLYASIATLNAARSGGPFPEGAVITMEDFRGGELHRILVMEKRAEWADRSEAGGWLFREFAPDGTPKLGEDGKRCEACHASQSANDYVFTRDRMPK